jgi:biotin carboxyl carrier protein
MRFEFEIDQQKISIDHHASAAAQFFTSDGQPVDIKISRIGSQTYLVLAGSKVFEVNVSSSGDVHSMECNHRLYRVKHLRAAASNHSGNIEEDASRVEIRAPMPGKIIKVMVADGSLADFNQPLMVIEAMKMQNELRAPRKGTVVSLSVFEGQAVPAGALLLALE